MTRREDHSTNTPEQAATYEAHRAEPDDERPTLAEAERDECQHLHQTDVAVTDPIPSRPTRVCRDCGQRCEP